MKYDIDYPITFEDYDPPEILYHYTTQQGFIGIISSHCLWATDIRYLNDSSEYSYGEQLAKRVISRRKQKAKGNVKKFFNEFDEAADIFSEQRCFIVSLTENGDLLSQWRGYTSTGMGLSLGFSVDNLKTILGERNEFNLVKCIYDQDEQEALINSAIDYALDYWKQRKTPAPKSPPGRIQIGFYPPAILKIFCSFLAPVLKSASFYEEQEWRLVVAKNERSIFKFRAGQSMITPYAEIDLLAKPDETETMPISEVIIGPTPHPDLASFAVQMLLDSYSIDAYVKISEIPFRSW